jgi:hypothetical protein
VSSGVVNHTVSAEALSPAAEAQSGTEKSGLFAMQLSAAVQTAAAQPMSREKRDALVGTAYEQSKQLRVLTDPKTSSEERSEAAQDMEERSTQLSDQQDDAGPDSGEPEDPIGKSAQGCANAIFETKADRTLAQRLKNLIPESWSQEEVKDFWKTQNMGNEQLDVYVQLQNDTYVHAPIEISSLIVKLAELVPRSELQSAIGPPDSARCLWTAWYLDEDFGVAVGSWLE